MKKIFLFSLVSFSIAPIGYAQTSVKYFEYVDQAKRSFENKEYKKSSNFYANAFRLNAGKAYCEDRYNAARAWTLSGNNDSAFIQLFKVVTLYDYTNYKQLSEDTDFLQLHNDKRWNQITDNIKQNISKTDSNLNSGLVILLDSVYRNHYSYRLTEVSIKNKFGPESIENKEVKKTIRQKDSVNLAIVTAIIEKYGWLGKKVVGPIGNYTLALILQNADLKTQEKYLPEVRDAFKNKNIEAYDFALLEDKVALRQGKHQLYGSVIVSLNNRNYIAPVGNVESLNERRIQLGLKSMNEYLTNWRMEWDINDYKKDLLFLENEKIEY